MGGYQGWGVGVCGMGHNCVMGMGLSFGVREMFWSWIEMVVV